MRPSELFLALTVLYGLVVVARLARLILGDDDGDLSRWPRESYYFIGVTCVAFRARPTGTRPPAPIHTSSIARHRTATAQPPHSVGPRRGGTHNTIGSSCPPALRQADIGGVRGAHGFRGRSGETEVDAGGVLHRQLPHLPAPRPRPALPDRRRLRQRSGGRGRAIDRGHAAVGLPDLLPLPRGGGVAAAAVGAAPGRALPELPDLQCLQGAGRAVRGGGPLLRVRPLPRQARHLRLGPCQSVLPPSPSCRHRASHTELAQGWVGVGHGERCGHGLRRGPRTPSRARDPRRPPRAPPTPTHRSTHHPPPPCVSSGRRSPPVLSGQTISFALLELVWHWLGNAVRRETRWKTRGFVGLGAALPAFMACITVDAFDNSSGFVYIDGRTEHEVRGGSRSGRAGLARTTRGTRGARRGLAAHRLTGSAQLVSHCAAHWQCGAGGLRGHERGCVCATSEAVCRASRVVCGR